MSRKINLTDRHFNRLTVISEDRTENKRTYWLCQCECGREVIVQAQNLTTGHTKSCGCLLKDWIRETKTTHGLTRSREFKIWDAMKGRCYRPNDTGFFRYGARGITVCERWLNSFEAFYKDMGPRPTSQHTLERKNNEGPYSPENCVWATKTQQAQNRRSSTYLTFQGKTLCVTEWARVTGIRQPTLFNRLKDGLLKEQSQRSRPR